MDAGELTSLVLHGVADGSAAQRFLRYYAFRYSIPERRGREYRSVLPIGPAAGSDPGAAPVGQIIMSWSAEGVCTASLIASGPVTIGEGGTIAALTSLVQQQFGFQAVTGRGKEWTAPELRSVARALMRMPDEDQPGLAGLTLVRMPQVAAAHPGIDALYYRRQAYQAQQITDIAELQVGDGAFSDDSRIFVGTAPASCRPASFHRILHEAAHALEESRYRTSLTARMTAGLQLDQAGATLRMTGAAGAQARHDAAKGQYDQATAAHQASKGQVQRSVPLDRFTAWVRTRGISPVLTDYARDSWPGQPQEFYADAYALWRLDPEFLAGFSADLVAFFEAGTHRP